MIWHVSLFDTTRYGVEIIWGSSWKLKKNVLEINDLERVFV